MTRNPNKAPTTLDDIDKELLDMQRSASDTPESIQADIDSVYEYAHNLNAMGNRIERIENAAQAVGIDDHSWADPEEGIDGGAALVKLAERMHAAETYELSEDEKKFLKYEDSAMAVFEARASIDQDQLRERSPADSFSGALEAEVKRERDLRKQRIEQAEEGTLPEEFRGDVSYFEASMKRQNITLRYLESQNLLENYGNQLLDAIDAKSADPENPEVLTAFEEASKNATKSKKVNKAVAKTFAELAEQYPNEEYQAPVIELEQEAESVPASEQNSAAHNAKTATRSQAKHGKKAKSGPGTQGPGRQTGHPATPGNSRRSSRQENQPASTETADEEERVLTPAGAAIRHQARRRAEQASGNQPPAGPPNNPGNGNGNSGENSGNNSAKEKQDKNQEMRLKGQRLRVQNAAERLANEGRRRSRLESFAGEGDEHEAFRAEVLKLMMLEHPEFLQAGTINDAEKEDLKALNAHMNAYVTEKYNLVTKATVDGMGGEKDPKKRKRNNRIIRIGASTVGMFLGGPAGAVVAGSIALGVTKAIDHEFKGREELANSINEYSVQQATDEYINSLGDATDFNSVRAFEAATKNLREQYERGVVIGRQKRIGGAFLVGGAWGLGTYLGLHQAADVLGYAGGVLRHDMAQALGSDYNYMPTNKPFSLSALQWIYNNPAVAGFGVTAAAGAAHVVARARRARPQTSGNGQPNNRRRPSNGSPRPLVNA